MKNTKKAKKRGHVAKYIAVMKTGKKHIRRHAKTMKKKNMGSRKKNSTVIRAKAQVKQQKRMTPKQKREKLNIPEPKIAKEAINTIMNDVVAVDYLLKNVSRNAIDVLTSITTPKTAEQVSEILDIKINFVRSMLNIMQGYGITNYYVAKNDNGWLSFAWYVNVPKIQSFFEYIKSIKKDDTIIKDNCNDYFVCSKCYDETKQIFDFDAAYEDHFKCKVCNSKFKMISKEGAKELIHNQVSDQNKP